jgi:hypothetical protein
MRGQRQIKQVCIALRVIGDKVKIFSALCSGLLDGDYAQMTMSTWFHACGCGQCHRQAAPNTPHSFNGAGRSVNPVLELKSDEKGLPRVPLQPRGEMIA